MRLRDMVMVLGLALGSRAWAADHLDTPTVSEDPAADIGDVYAWMAPEGERLNAVIDIVGKAFSDRLAYVLHVDSGSALGATRASTSVICRFDPQQRARCWVGKKLLVKGDVSATLGLADPRNRLRIFAGERDDPFFNNVRGTRAALNAAHAALSQQPIAPDASGFFAFDSTTLTRIASEWRHTEGGPPRNFLEGWSTGALVISVDRDLVDDGGPLLAVWAGTYRIESEPASDDAPPLLGERIDRMGRALTGNGLIGPLDEAATANARKEAYNRAAPEAWPSFVPDIARTLGLYDSFDGVAGNQWRSDAEASPADRYRALAKLLADDRLWIDSRATRCAQYLSVELGHAKPGEDCGGRTPNYNADAVFRSLLIRGTTTTVDDGLREDDARHSDAVFPFLAAPRR